MTNFLCGIGLCGITAGLYLERPSLAIVFVGLVLAAVGVVLHMKKLQGQNQ